MTQVISVVQEKGGAGKTTLITSLAALMVEDGARVAMIDTDDRRNLEAWAKKRQVDIDWMYEIDEDRLAPVVANLSKSSPPYDAIMIDTAGFKGQMAFYAMFASDLVLIPAKADESNAKAARRTYNQFKMVVGGAQKPKEARVVMMDVDPRTNITKVICEALDAAEVPRLQTMCGHRTGFKEMQTTGKGPEGSAKAAARSVLGDLQSQGLINFYNQGGSWAKISA